MADVVDFFPRPKNTTILSSATASHYAYREARNVPEELKKWLVRRVECIRGNMSLGLWKSFALEAVGNCTAKRLYPR